MKFELFLTSSRIYNGEIEKINFLKSLGFIPTYERNIVNFEKRTIFIELSTLEELIELINKLKEDIIISTDYLEDGNATIEIYNSYRE